MAAVAMGRRVTAIGLVLTVAWLNCSLMAIDDEVRVDWSSGWLQLRRQRHRVRRRRDSTSVGHAGEHSDGSKFYRRRWPLLECARTRRASWSLRATRTPMHEIDVDACGARSLPVAAAARSAAAAAVDERRAVAAGRRDGRGATAGRLTLDEPPRVSGGASHQQDEQLSVSSHGVGCSSAPRDRRALIFVHISNSNQREA